MEDVNDYRDPVHEISVLRDQLREANDTIEAIRNGEIDALVVHGKNGHELYTLRSADRTYRNFIEQMSEGAITLNYAGVVVYCNTSLARMVGKDAEEIISCHFLDLVNADDHENYNSLIKKAWNNDIKGEVKLKRNSSLVPVRLSITLLKMDEATALSLIVTDLTSHNEILGTLKANNDQLELINKQLELSNHDLQQFASVASHDLQEPLRKIQVFSHLLKEKFSDDFPDMAKTYLGKMVHAANRMKVLIIDILNYSRLSSNDKNYFRTDIRVMISELLVDLELVIKEKEAVISVGDLPLMEINPGQMRQVFQNLISNSLKFSRHTVPPLIDIWCESVVKYHTILKRQVPFCNIHVRDNGIGFDKKFSSSIFNLFEKLHSKDEYDGSGIGLAITRKIIEKHHGEISVLSEVNVGTEFIISLPIEQLSE